MKDIMAYSSGDGVTSVMLNSILNFAMLFYTQVIGLDATLAGLAISISIFWDYSASFAIWFNRKCMGCRSCCTSYGYLVGN